jgi:lysozyme
MSEARVSTTSKVGLVGSVIAMMALALATVAPFEGKRNEPYRDPIGILTVCYGETRVEMRRYSDAECMAMLEQGVVEFAEGVRLRNPGIASYPRQWAAHTSFAYNVGLARYGRSSVARLFSEGRQRAACEFMTRYKYADGHVLAGLVRRRAAERALCLENAVG